MARGLILLGGEFPPPEWVKSLYQPSDAIIAADRGFLLAKRCDLPVQVLLGDFDSLSPQELASVPAGAAVRRFPVDKDFSDGELALSEAHSLGLQEVIFLGALGGRLDHCLFNVIALLQGADELGIKASLAHPGTRVFQAAAGEALDFSAYRGWMLSLITLDATATVDLEGTLYSLQRAQIKRSSTLCLSNRVDSSPAGLRVHSGRVLAILSSAPQAPIR